MNQETCVTICRVYTVAMICTAAPEPSHILSVSLEWSVDQTPFVAVCLSCLSAFFPPLYLLFSLLKLVASVVSCFGDQLLTSRSRVSFALCLSGIISIPAELYHVFLTKLFFLRCMNSRSHVYHCIVPEYFITP